MNFSIIKDMVISGVLPSLIVSLFIMIVCYKKGKKVSMHSLLFVFYIFMLLYVTVYRYGISYQSIISERVNINFRPIRETYSLYINGGWGILLYNILGNIVWFIPLGWYGAYFYKNLKLTEIFFITMGLSLSIEIVQFILNCGITDIDDVIFNTIDGVIGYVICSLMTRK